jgi:excisionase family DNA binding protein
VEGNPVNDDLTVPEAAELTRQSPSMIRKLIRTGRFPHAYKTGTGGKTSPILIPRKDVDNYKSTQPLAYTA